MAARTCSTLGPAVVVVTRGGEGASWVARSGAGTVAALPVEVADTIGAGDTFGAALLDALWERDLVGAAAPARPCTTWARRAGERSWASPRPPPR